MNQVLDVISSRRSHRAYADTPLTEEQIRLLLKAGAESPSAVNRQPWHFSVVRDQQLLDEINAETRAAMLKKAVGARSPRFADESFHVFYRAPCVIFISGDPQNPYSQIDCGIAVQNIVLAAESLGLGTVILGLPRDAFTGDRRDEFCRRLCFPEGYVFEIAVSVGIPADAKEPHPVREGHNSFIG